MNGLSKDEVMIALMEWYDRREHYDPDAHGARARFQSTMRASLSNLNAAGFSITESGAVEGTP